MRDLSSDLSGSATAEQLEVHLNSAQAIMIFVVKFLLDSCFEPIQLKMPLFLHLGVGSTAFIDTAAKHSPCPLLPQHNFCLMPSAL